MPSPLKIAIKILALAVALIAVAMLADAWHSARQDSQKLAATLAAQNNSIQQASDREKQRDQQLAATLSQIQTQKRNVRTPDQAAQNLTAALPELPLPISVRIPNLSVPASHSDTQIEPQSEAQETTLLIPTPDLLPLYNNLQDCRSSEAQSEALKKDLADEKARSASLEREKAAAQSAAQGGSIFVRMKRAAKWFLLGAAVAAAATAAARRHP